MHIFLRSRTFLLHLASLAALAAGTSLLVADSAGPQCKDTTFDRTFEITTHCGGDSIARVRLTAKAASGNSQPLVRMDKLLGDVNVVSASVTARCEKDNDPFTFKTLTLQIGIPDADRVLPVSDGGVVTGSNVRMCEVDLATRLDSVLTCPGTQPCTVF